MATTTKLGPANVLSEDEVRRVLAACSKKGRVRRYPTGERNYALVMTLWRAGLRISEALDLRRTDVRLDGARPMLTVRSGKGGKSRVVGVHAELAEALLDWWTVAPVSELAFSTLAGGPLSASYARAMVSRKGRRAGVARVHPHAFRATLAVELVQEGVTIPAVRDVLGHVSIAQTDAYLRRVFPSQAISAVIDR